MPNGTRRSISVNTRGVISGDAGNYHYRMTSPRKVMNAPASTHIDWKTTSSVCSVETMTAELKLLTWPAQTIEFAELLARKLSIAAIDDPSYPNPFFVVECCGRARSHFLCGKRNAEALPA
jgi:hypothetical protein